MVFTMEIPILIKNSSIYLEFVIAKKIFCWFELIDTLTLWENFIPFRINERDQQNR